MVVLFSIPLLGYSYPQFVGHGYTSCITCHYNPFGNGPLNDYGRALSATAVSAKWFYHEKTSEEKIAGSSGFWGKIPKNSWFRPSLDYRGMVIKRTVGQSTEDNELIHMQADANLVLKFGKTNNFFLSGTIGYAPTPLALDEDADVKNYRSREHYIGYRPVSNLGIYAGLMDRIFGIRVPEHTAYSRSVNDLSQNDQTHGIQLHFSNPSFELGAGYYIGNLVQDEDIRLKGYSAKLDYIVSHKSSIGISYQLNSNEYVEKVAAAFHYMGSVGKGSSILVEGGKTTATSKVDTSDESSRTYGFVQNNTNLSRGVYFIQTVEYLKEDDGDELYRIGPGIQFFPIQRMEVRCDLYNTKNFSEEVSTKDNWDLLMQLHTWF